MILHLVLFRFRAGTPAERIAEAGQALVAMRDRISEIRAAGWGPNLGPSGAEYPHVLTITCDDMDAVQRYADHPVHRDTVARFIAPIRDARLAVDVELQGEA